MSLPLSLEVALRVTLRARDDLIRAARAIPSENHMWRPSDLAHNVVEIVAHCAAANQFFAAVITGAPIPFRTQEEREAAVQACDTLDKAEAFLNQSVTAVCDAIVSMPEDRLHEQMVMPWGERMTVAQGLLSPSFHMQYHEGQINFIQVLLGDTDYH